MHHHISQGGDSITAKKVLTTPVKAEGLEDIRIGDIIYLSGHITICRNVIHKRLIEGGRKLPVGLEGGAILHVGPIIHPLEDGRYRMVSVGPTASICMGRLEREFIWEAGVYLVVGEGNTDMGIEERYKEYKVLHCVFPVGCAVVAVGSVEEIEWARWLGLGVPETLWAYRVGEFGLLIVSTDTYGRDLFE